MPKHWTEKSQLCSRRPLATIPTQSLELLEHPGYSSASTSLMVEPFATVVINTLLSGRSTLRYTASVASPTRIMTRTPRSSLGPGFFTPQPRREKGKERETACRLNECREWSSCVQRHSLWCPHQSRFSMLHELNLDQNASLRRSKGRHTFSCSRRGRAKHRSGLHGEQRRHASNCTELAEAPIAHFESPVASSSTRMPHRLNPSSRRLAALSKLPRSQFSLEEGWEAFTAARNCSVPMHLLLTFMDRLVTAAEGSYHRDDPSLWGHRIADVLRELDPDTEQLSEWRLRLLARSMALAGNIEKALLFARTAKKMSLLDGDEGNMIRVYEQIMLSISKRRDKVAVLEFIVAEWSFLGRFLSQRSKQGSSSPRPVGRVLRKIAFASAAEVQDPASVLVHNPEWSREHRESIGNFLIEVFCFFQIPINALEVYHEMQRQCLHTPTGLQLTLVRSLTSAGVFGSANALYTSIPKRESPQYHLSTGLHLYSHRGSIEEAESCYKELKDHDWVSPNDVTMLIYVYTRQTQAHHKKHGHTLFNRLYPKGPDGKRLNTPRLADYNAVIHGHKTEGDVEGASYWLEDMLQSGLSPDVYVYTSLLDTLAVANDLTGIQVVLDHMRNTGIQPNAGAYTVLITLLAHRKDVMTAEIVFQQALQEGVVADRQMLTSLMNAHVEAGSWKGVIRIFDYIHSYSSRRQIRPTIEVYNTLLKAYVLSGSPLWVVSKVVQQLETAGIKPDNRTFSLLIQSACDAGRMDIASDLFWDLDHIAETQKERGLSVTVYALTILLAGFLRQRDKVKAKSVYDEMVARGIQPSAITFGAILKAYGNEGTQSSIAVAETFIKGLVGASREEQGGWNTASHGRKAAIDHIYGPLLAAYSKQGKTEEVERVVQEMVNAGGSPSLGTLATVLDAYRRKFDINAVLEIWPQILRLGLAQRNSLPERMKGHPNRANFRGFVLSAPFSIYIDALSAAGLHSNLAATWHELIRNSFSFDSHNWNHFAVALVRAGDVERALEVVEKVLLTTEHQGQDFIIERDTNPSSPLLFTPISSENSTGETPSDPVERNASRRSHMVKKATNNMALLDVDGEESRYKHDFAHPLHILHQISPSWGEWRPHKAVLTVLLMVLTRLESGFMVHPVRPDNEEDFPVENEAHQARQVLQRIYQNYPDAVKAVSKHETRERHRLGIEYDSTYNLK